MKQKTISQPEVGTSPFCQLSQWLQAWISLLGCLEVRGYLHHWAHYAHSIKLFTAAHFLLLQRLHHACRLLHMLQQPWPLYGQGNSPGPLQFLQLGVIPTQWTMETLVSDFCSTIQTLSLGNLSIVPWVRFSLTWQGNVEGSALLLCYWASPQ